MVIAGKTAAQIRVTAAEVFQAEGYQLHLVNGNEMVFDKRRGPWSSALYGGWTAADVWLRLRVRLRPAGPDTCVVEARASRVSGRDGGAFEEERPYSRAQAATCRRLLAALKARLQTPASS